MAGAQPFGARPWAHPLGLIVFPEPHIPTSNLSATPVSNGDRAGDPSLGLDSRSEEAEAALKLLGAVGLGGTKPLNPSWSKATRLERKQVGGVG